jgi:hypothetical protein
MTLYVNTNPNVVPKIVYAGAAPGHNIALLSKLFPSCEFHLYDTNKFSDLLVGNRKITLYKQLFLDVDAEGWKDKDEVYFISDIRRDIVGKTTRDAEVVIMGDMNMQKKWIEIMKPVQSHLKFHLPYSGLNLGSTFEYFNGTVYVQPWRGSSSTECRLVPKWGEKRLWDNKKYEDQNFYINSILREKTKFYNTTNGSKDPIDGKELLNDYDSAMEISILSDYIKKFSPDPQEDLKYVINMSRILTNTITFYMETNIKSNVCLKHLRVDRLLLAPKSGRFTEYTDLEE